MVHWFVTVSTTKISRKYRLWYNVSVPYPKPGLAENTGNVELGAAPLVQHYSLYHGLATFTEVTFVNVHHAQMSTFVCLWYIGFVTVSTTKINRKYRLWYNVSVPYPKPGLAENTGNVELGAAPLVQHFSVFSARPGLGYGTLIQCDIGSWEVISTCAESYLIY